MSHRVIVDHVRSADGTRLALDVVGSGPPLVLVGGAFSFRRWKGFVELAQLLADDFTVVGYDRADARASSVETTDWARIAALYGTLHQATGSAVVELNRAVAVAMAQGPQAGLTIVDEIEPALPGFHLVPAVRGDLLARLGLHAEAAAQFDRAAELAANGTERALMKARADTCRQRGATAS